MGRRRTHSGSDGEDVASAMLVRRGCTILARNVHSGPDEIDLVVLDGGERVAVEVKSTSRESIDPLGAVDGGKLERVRRAAARIDPAISRIDVVGVRADGGTVEIRWLVRVG